MAALVALITCGLLSPTGAAASAAPGQATAPPAGTTYTARDFRSQLPPLPFTLGGVGVANANLFNAANQRVGNLYQQCTVVETNRNRTTLLCSIYLRLRDGDIATQEVADSSLLTPGPTTVATTGAIIGGTGDNYRNLRGDVAISSSVAGSLTLVLNPV
ncbi:hypothetical protein GCM10010174_36440 [Kutzneria viridogrisea]|uniref:Dirigent-like protein n=1 Tax=Kutzneria viridogrisea TaxID=47990 RepID=A0ABR6BV39_9PSEU|nr:hypothetical protein [Kutzneria viridogrisea]